MESLNNTWLTIKKLLAVCLLLTWAPQLQAEPHTLQIPLGQQQSLSFNQSVTRLAVGDPEVADVKVVGGRDVLITSKRLGGTSLKVWVKGGAAVRDYLIEITPAAGMRAALAQAGVQIEPAGNGLVLGGDARSLPGHAAALATANPDAEDAKLLADQSRMGFRHQVQTDIKIVEISRSKLKNAGFYLDKLSSSGVAAISPPGVLSSVTSDQNGFALTSGSGFLPSFESFNFVLGRTGGVLGTLSVLEGNGFAYTLAEPSLVTLSGQSASFHVGGEFPIPIRQGSGSDSSVSVEFKEFGIRLFLTPTVLSEDQIMLRVAPEVSELDFTSGIESGGVSVPSLRVRRTETSIELGNGQSFVISGLVSRETAANVDKVPGLGNIPVLGAFFRSSRLEVNDRELIMVVTPRLVSPLAAGAQLPPLPGERYRNYDPDFKDFMFGETGEFKQGNESYGFSD